MMTDDSTGTRRFLRTFFYMDQAQNPSFSIIPPLSFFTKANVVVAANLTSTSRSTPVTSGDHMTANVVLLTKPYKNNIKSINAVIDSLLAFREGQHTDVSAIVDVETNTAPTQPPCQVNDIEICGSGGSIRALDAFAPNFDKISSKDAQYLSAAPQDTTSKQNTTMVRLTERRGIVAVFIGYDEFKPFMKSDMVHKLTNNSQGGDCLFLGYHYFASMTYKACSAEEASAFYEDVMVDGDLQDPKQREQFRMFSSFREDLHFTFTLKPVFDNHDKIQRVLQLDCQKRWRITNIHSRVRTFGTVKLASIAECTKFIDKFISHKFGSSSSTSGFEAKKNDESPMCATLRDFSDISVSSQETVEKETEEDIAHPSGDNSESDMGDQSDSDETYIAVPTVVGDYSLEEVLPDAKGTRARDAGAVVWHLIRTTVATSMRYLGLTIGKSPAKKQRIVCFPISNKFASLSSIYRAHPSPFPCRTYDVMPLILRSCAFQMGCLDTSQPFTRSSMPVNTNLFFMSILNRFTGRPGVYKAWRSSMNGEGDEVSPVTTSGSPLLKLLRSKQTLLPRICECSSFVSFIDNKRIHSSLFNSQHISAVPSDMKRHIDVFCDVVMAVSSTCGHCLQRMQNKKTNRAECVDILTAFLIDILDKNRPHVHDRMSCQPKLAFLAHQVISDLEEVYDSPFGDVTADSVVIGYGGGQGLAICRDLCVADKASTGAKRASEREFLKSLETIIVGELSRTDEVGVQTRRMMGLKLNKSLEVCVSLNNRPLRANDIEHFMCKVYIGVAKTISSRGSSSSPKSYKPGLHPIRFKDNDIAWDDTHVRTILMGVLDEYRQCSNKNTLPPADTIFLLEGEQSV